LKAKSKAQGKGALKKRQKKARVIATDFQGKIAKFAAQFKLFDFYIFSQNTDFAKR